MYFKLLQKKHFNILYYIYGM